MAKTMKYEQVVEWVRKRIAAGELSAGDRLESENEISTLFHISRQTARHGLDVLVEEGLLLRVRGSGTYVGKGIGQTEAENGGNRPELSKTVTIISTYLDGYIFPKILQSMVRSLEQYGYGVRIMFTNNRVETERRLLSRLLKEQSRDPLIVEPVMSGLPNPNLEYYQRLKDRGIPILFFHSFYPELNIPHISMNDVQAGQIATEYLIERGHTKIAGIFKSDDGQGQRRYNGYLKALLLAGLEIPEEHVCWVDTQDMKNFSKVHRKLSERLQGCTACVCYNDEVAHELTRFVLDSGIRIPEQLSVASIDNSDLARLNAVPLTSVIHPMEELGAKAAESIIQLIQCPEEDVTFEFPVMIKERGSVTRI